MNDVGVKINGEHKKDRSNPVFFYFSIFGIWRI